MEAQAKADPEARYRLHFRYVALSACLANARSLAGWLNVEKGLFSFHSSVKVNPLQIRVDAFDINHTGTRLLAMSKPVYTTITGLSNGNSTLVFVPSRKQAQMTAIDILTFVSSTTQPKRFNHISEVSMNNGYEWQEELNTVLSNVVDPALKTVLEGGIGYFFKVGGVSPYV